MKLLLFFSVLLLAQIWVKGHDAESECQSTMTVIRNALTSHRRPLDTCSNCQGRPGKRGVVGPAGPIGPRGPHGPPGTCECDFSIVDELREQIRALEEFKIKASEFPGLCYAGVYDGRIPLSHLKASSVHGTCRFSGVILNANGAWCTAHNNADQWIQVDFRSPKKLTGILTQGRSNHDQWVTSFKVSYGNAEYSLTNYMEGGSIKVFQGNRDRNGRVKNEFSHPITARYFRIHPVTYRGHMSMRLEFLEC